MHKYLRIFQVPPSVIEIRIFIFIFFYSSVPTRYYASDEREKRWQTENKIWAIFGIKSNCDGLVQFVRACVRVYISLQCTVRAALCTAYRWDRFFPFAFNKRTESMQNKLSFSLFFTLLDNAAINLCTENEIKSISKCMWWNINI